MEILTGSFGDLGNHAILAGLGDGLVGLADLAFQGVRLLVAPELRVVIEEPGHATFRSDKIGDGPQNGIDAFGQLHAGIGASLAPCALWRAVG